MLNYRRETALQGALVLAKSKRLEVGDNILQIVFNNCDAILLKNYPIRREKRKIK